MPCRILVHRNYSDNRQVWQRYLEPKPNNLEDDSVGRCCVRDRTFSLGVGGGPGLVTARYWSLRHVIDVRQPGRKNKGSEFSDAEFSNLGSRDAGVRITFARLANLPKTLQSIQVHRVAIVYDDDLGGRCP